jgi:hypothetical protein
MAASSSLHSRICKRSVRCGSSDVIGGFFNRQAESVLQQAGHDTLSAATVAEAQSIINLDDKFDLVFADLRLAL